ncbi:carboxypeptidase-like regulatory domain-containing protein, partial [candidate division KSB1 bacterium]|nr:carboxypeptidase-like regulatory domain-containing protein [candidate division KSB1 bacterium]
MIISKKLIYLLLLFSMLMTSQLFSQVSFGTIKGIVVDLQSRQPLRDVIVKIQRASAVAVTDATGLFSFPQVPVGTYTLEFIKDGYQTLILPRQVVSPGKATSIRGELAKGAASEADVFYIGGIEITAEKE